MAKKKKDYSHDHELNDYIGYPADHVLAHSNGEDHDHPKDKYSSEPSTSNNPITNANRVGHGGFGILDDPESEYAEPVDPPVDEARPPHDDLSGYIADDQGWGG
jgi:hypothetical protein